MLNLPERLKAAASRWKTPPSFRFGRPLLLMQSDDWGRVGVRDREGWEQLCAAGINLGAKPYDFYSLETSEDVAALSEVLQRHRDSTGRSACLTMNFIVANPDFAKTIDGEFKNVSLHSLADGLPGSWKRPDLFEAYRRGMAKGMFYPALHGTTHFCRAAVEDRLATNEEARKLLLTLWKAETPYIYWRMPWIGYEYWSPAKQFLVTTEQQALIRQSAELFLRMFGTPARSACAPGYRADDATRCAWEQCGVRIVQNGSGGAGVVHLNQKNMLEIYRNVDFEPATAGPEFALEDCVRQAQNHLDRRRPAVVSVHSINFHSTLRDFRTPTLDMLDQFLSALEKKYPDLLYVHDADLYELITRGCFEGPQGRVAVRVESGAFGPKKGRG